MDGQYIKADRPTLSQYQAGTSTVYNMLTCTLIIFAAAFLGCNAGRLGAGGAGGYYGHGGGYHGAQQVARPYYAGSYDESPKPFDFSYVAPAIGGQSTRKETGDGSGRVVGSYTLNDDDGRSRVVEYIADAGGFRATVKTNELGTKSENPADVVIHSSAPDPHAGGPLFSGPGAHRPYAPGRYAGQAANAIHQYGKHAPASYGHGGGYSGRW